jgi:hypothetical protein
MDESKEAIEKLRKSMDVSLLMAENYQNRCHDAEKIMFEFHLLKWWQFKERKRLQASVKSHYDKYVNVDFKSYIKTILK